MTSICQHLAAYADVYERTRVNYQVCLDLMDLVLAGDTSPALVTNLEQSLNDWELENRQMRELFESLVNRGAISLPTVDGELVPAGQAETASVCAKCGAEIPRLEFEEWSFAENGAVQFRGRNLRTEEPQPA